MILKGSQIIDLSPDGSGRAGQLAPVVGITGNIFISCIGNEYLFEKFLFLSVYL